jgi:hypothetical protein
MLTIFITSVIVMTLALCRSAALVDRKIVEDCPYSFIDFNTQNTQKKIELTASAD